MVHTIVGDILEKTDCFHALLISFISLRDDFIAVSMVIR